MTESALFFLPLRVYRRLIVSQEAFWKMIEVFRIENRSGHGPYEARTIDFPNRYLTNSMCDRHPNPFDDILEWSELTTDRRNYRFGFETLKQLNEWFHKEERAFLAQSSFFLYVYEVSWIDILVGEKQIAFYNQTAKRVRQLDLVTLFNR